MRTNIKRAAIMVTALTFFQYSPLASASLSARIEDYALNATSNLTEDSAGVRRLYGVVVNPKDTDYGKFACALVTSVVLSQAGVRVPRLVKGESNRLALGVWEVEARMKKLGWRTVTAAGSVLPGDVVIFDSTLPWKPDDCKKGSGSCHVGIETRQGLFHNHPWFGRPHLGDGGLTFYRFKIAYRPPD